MNIGINATAISNKKGGASFYIKNIINSFAEIDSQNKFVLFTTKIGKNQFPNLPSNFDIISNIPANVFKRLLWEQLRLPLLCRKYSLEVLFSPNYTVPVFLKKVRSVVTIHDLSFFPLEKLYPRSRRIFKQIIKWSIKCADSVIAVSEFTKKDIIRYIGNYDEKVKVIYEGADKRFNVVCSNEEIKEIKKKYSINGDYILFTGFLEPRKNLERLLQAYALIKKQIKQNLVIVGGKGWWYEQTFTHVKELRLEDRVVFTGYVDDFDLPPLYSGATIFAFPSLYEGFGIAVLESISCGTPVLVSNNTALPEVAGNAATYVDPYNIKDIAEKLERVLTSPEELLSLKKNCSEIAKKFSWKRAGRETLEVLKQ